MTTKKITLNELKSLVKQIIKEETENLLVKSFKTNYAPYTTFNVYSEGNEFIVKAETKGYGEFTKKKFKNQQMALEYAKNLAKSMSDDDYEN